MVIDVGGEAPGGALDPGSGSATGPGLDTDVVAGVLAAVAPGRNVRRRLAHMHTPWSDLTG